MKVTTRLRIGKLLWSGRMSHLFVNWGMISLTGYSFRILWQNWRGVGLAKNKQLINGCRFYKSAANVDTEAESLKKAAEDPK